MFKIEKKNRKFDEKSIFHGSKNNKKNLPCPFKEQGKCKFIIYLS
jgi:hypothetical protein